jgi:hypothetical protein
MFLRSGAENGKKSEMDAFSDVQSQNALGGVG